MAAILLDLVMPETDGFAVIHHLKASTTLRGIPVIVLTAKDLSKQDIDFLERETNAYFQKGLNWKESLLAEIREATGGVQELAGEVP